MTSASISLSSLTVLPEPGRKIHILMQHPDHAKMLLGKLTEENIVVPIAAVIHSGHCSIWNRPPAVTLVCDFLDIRDQTAHISICLLLSPFLLCVIPDLQYSLLGGRINLAAMGSLAFFGLTNQVLGIQCHKL